MKPAVGAQLSHPPGRMEAWPWLALFPALATALFYALPESLQSRAPVQFIPQILAYLALALWAGRNPGRTASLGLGPHLWRQGLVWGLPTGLALGGFNTAVILHLAPRLGGDIAFLRDTPHAQAPVLFMLPWFILLIAVFVEVNFRGFQLGRFLALFQPLDRLGPALALLVSALVFAFDPFMVATFRHLHWIAVWDGLVWGLIWLCLRNLYATIIAHAVEVVVMYSILKAVL